MTYNCSVDPGEFQAIMTRADGLINREKADEAVFAIEDMLHNKPSMPVELKTYRKHVKTIIKLLHQQQELLDGYSEMFNRLVSDSEEKKGCRWQPEEDELLIDMVCDGETSMLEISTTLGRTVPAIKTRISKLVGVKRISKEIAGRFVGLVDGRKTKCFISGELFNE